MAPAPKFRRRAEARPDEILDAALAVFTSKGFEAARMDEIAVEAGISKGAVYLYFDSKEALLKGLIEREVAPVAAKLRAMADIDGDPKETLSQLIKAASEMLSHERIFATPKVVLSIAARFPEIAAFYRERIVDEGIAAIARLHRRGVKRGDFRDADSETVARLVMGPLLVYAMRKHVLGAKDAGSAEKRSRAHIDILFEGLVLR